MRACLVRIEDNQEGDISVIKPKVVPEIFFEALFHVTHRKHHLSPLGGGPIVPHGLSHHHVDQLGLRLRLIPHIDSDRC